MHKDVHCCVVTYDHKNQRTNKLNSGVIKKAMVYLYDEMYSDIK